MISQAVYLTFSSPPLPSQIKQLPPCPPSPSFFFSVSVLLEVLELGRNARNRRDLRGSLPRAERVVLDVRPENVVEVPETRRVAFREGCRVEGFASGVLVRVGWERRGGEARRGRRTLVVEAGEGIGNGKGEKVSTDDNPLVIKVGSLLVVAVNEGAAGGSANGTPLGEITNDSDVLGSGPERENLVEGPREVVPRVGIDGLE